MVEFSRLLPISLTLLALGAVTGFASTVVTSLLSSNSGKVIGVIVLICMLVASAFCLFLGFFGNKDGKSRAIYVTAAVFGILGAIFAIALKKRFHITASYLDRLVMYYVIILGIQGMLSIFWPYVTKLFASSILEEVNIDKIQEALLYLTENFVAAFISAMLVTASTKVGKKIAISIAAWIINGLLAACLGFILYMKNDSGAKVETADSINASTDYDKIG